MTRPGLGANPTARRRGLATAIRTRKNLLTNDAHQRAAEAPRVLDDSHRH